MRLPGRLNRVNLAARLGQDRLRRIEVITQIAQGKGWGYATVSQENAAVHRLLGENASAELVIVDGGANVGAWTLAALHMFPHATVHALEPGSVSFADLSAALAGESRARPHRVALSDSDGEAILYAPRPGSVRASLSKRELSPHDFSHEESVVVRTLTTWAREAGVSEIDVLKLDVEGHELQVLMGAGDLLAGVKVLQVEFGAPNIDTRTYFRDMWRLLSSRGFTVYRLGPRGLSAIEDYSPQDEVFMTTNYFATHACLDRTPGAMDR